MTAAGHLLPLGWFNYVLPVVLVYLAGNRILPQKSPVMSDSCATRRPVVLFQARSLIDARRLLLAKYRRASSGAT